VTPLLPRSQRNVTWKCFETLIEEPFIRAFIYNTVPFWRVELNKCKNAINNWLWET